MNELTNTSALLDLQKTISEMSAEGLLNIITKATDNSTGFSTRQSLDPRVEDVTLRRTPIFDMLPRVQVVNPIHQWDSITSGGTAISSFAGAIDSVGVDNDPVISRYSEAVRYYRATTTVGQFTNAMSRPQLKAQETVDAKTVEKIKYDIEKDIFRGASSSNTIRGFNSIINDFSPAANTESLGATLTETTAFDTVMREVVEQGGLSTHFVLNPKDKGAFADIFDNQIRYNDPKGMTNSFGYGIQKYMSDYGEVDVMWDLFVGNKTGTPAVSTGYVLDINTWSLGEPIINGAAGIATQDLAKVGPQNTKLMNYYGLLVYHANEWNGRVTNIQ